MTVISPPLLAETAQLNKAADTARQLSQLLLHTPEYEAYRQVRKAVDNDPDIQKVSTEIRRHKKALRGSREEAGEHEAALASLERELEALLVVRGYPSAEAAVRQMFAEVDMIVSQAAGVPFAANAQRGGCACGR